MLLVAVLNAFLPMGDLNEGLFGSHKERIDPKPFLFAQFDSNKGVGFVEVRLPAHELTVSTGL